MVLEVGPFRMDVPYLEDSRYSELLGGDTMGYPYQFLKVFRDHNTKRARENFSHPTDEAWWTNAIAGEAGEACNIAKKITRGDYKTPAELKVAREALAIELADVITYCDLLLAQLGYETDEILLSKFNEVSKRVGYPQVMF